MQEADNIIMLFLPRPQHLLLVDDNNASVSDIKLISSDVAAEHISYYKTPTAVQPRALYLMDSMNILYNRSDCPISLFSSHCYFYQLPRSQKEFALFVDPNTNAYFFQEGERFSQLLTSFYFLQQDCLKWLDMTIRKYEMVDQPCLAVDVFCEMMAEHFFHHEAIQQIASEKQIQDHTDIMEEQSKEATQPTSQLITPYLSRFYSFIDQYTIAVAAPLPSSPQIPPLSPFSPSSPFSSSSSSSPSSPLPAFCSSLSSKPLSLPSSIPFPFPSFSSDLPNMQNNACFMDEDLDLFEIESENENENRNRNQKEKRKEKEPTKEMQSIDEHSSNFKSNVDLDHEVWLHYLKHIFNLWLSNAEYRQHFEEHCSQASDLYKQPEMKWVERLLFLIRSGPSVQTNWFELQVFVFSCIKLMTFSTVFRVLILLRLFDTHSIVDALLNILTIKYIAQAQTENDQILTRNQPILVTDLQDCNKQWIRFSHLFSKMEPYKNRTQFC